MASYDSPKSRGRAPITDPKSDKPSGVGQTKSRQERGTGTAPKRVAVPSGSAQSNSYTATERRVGYQVKVGPNTKGTDTLKDPMNAYQRRVLSTSTDPDTVSPAERARYSRKAPGRNTGRPRLGSNS